MLVKGKECKIHPPTNSEIPEATYALDKVGGLGHKQAFSPRERDPLPTVKEVGLKPGPVWKFAETSSIPECDPRTDQQVQSRCTD